MDHTQIVKAVKSAQNRCGNSVIAANDKGDCFFGKDFPNGRLAVLKAAGLLGMQDIHVAAVDNFSRLAQKGLFPDGVVSSFVGVTVVAGGFPHAPGAEPGAGIDRGPQIVGHTDDGNISFQLIQIKTQRRHEKGGNPHKGIAHRFLFYGKRIIFLNHIVVPFSGRRSPLMLLRIVRPDGVKLCLFLFGIFSVHLFEDTQPHCQNRKENPKACKSHWISQWEVYVQDEPHKPGGDGG